MATPGQSRKSGIAPSPSADSPSQDVFTEEEPDFAGDAVPGVLQSASIGKLTAALAKAQAEMKAPKKGRTGKVSGTTKAGKDYDYEYGYADLADVIESSRGPLSKNGLAVMQPTIQRDGHIVLMTILSHDSGEWIAGELPIPAYMKPQEFGSLMTYFRRYGRSSLLDIAAEDDDDGKRAQDAEPKRHEAQPMGGDAAAILAVAGALEQHLGVDTDSIVKEYSLFTTKEGQAKFFTARDLESGKNVSAKWLKGVRDKLERELRKWTKDEPGAAEGAAMLTGDVDF